MSQEFVDAGDAVVALIRMKTKGRDSGIEANAKTPSGISFATARSRASTTTTTGSKPSKPWGWRGRGYRGYTPGSARTGSPLAAHRLLVLSLRDGRGESLGRGARLGVSLVEVGREVGRDDLRRRPPRRALRDVRR